MHNERLGSSLIGVGFFARKNFAAGTNEENILLFVAAWGFLFYALVGLSSLLVVARYFLPLLYIAKASHQKLNGTSSSLRE